MRGSLICTLFYLFVVAWAAGYQGCLERVWLYQAYLIDSLNDWDDQTIGWKCMDKGVDIHTTRCANYVRMAGSKKGQTLSYDQFVFNLGNAPGRTGWAVMSGGELDAEATALNTYKKYTTPQPGQAPGKAKAKNFPPWFAVKDVFEWNALIVKVGNVVDQTYRARSAGMDDATKKLFKNFDATRDLVIKVRTGDHGPYLIDQAKKQLPGMDIKIETLGTNPGNGNDYKTVNWAETEQAARDAGDKDAGTKITNFLDKWYGTGTGSDDKAREHIQVINSFKHLQSQQLACGR